jgi:hypothetical protein
METGARMTIGNDSSASTAATRQRCSPTRCGELRSRLRTTQCRTCFWSLGDGSTLFPPITRSRGFSESPARCLRRRGGHPGAKRRLLRSSHQNGARLHRTMRRLLYRCSALPLRDCRRASEKRCSYPPGRVSVASRPIDAGFFFYDVPEAHRLPKHAIAAVTALRDGVVVTAQTLSRDLLSGAGVPADAIESAKHQVAAIETRHGAAVVFEAPTRYEGRCWWLEFEGKRAPLGPCLPRGYRAAPFHVQLLATPDDVLLIGLVAAESVELRYADGEKVDVAVRRGVLLHEIPAAHLAAGHEPTAVRRLPQGATVDLTPSPCFRPLPLRKPHMGPGCLR